MLAETDQMSLTMRAPAKAMLRLQRVMFGTSPVTVFGAKDTISKIGMDVLPGNWQLLTDQDPLKVCIKPGEEGGKQVFVVCSASDLDRARWSVWLEKLDGLDVQSLALVVLDTPAPGAHLRRELEAASFAAGYRKHPAYYLILDYEALQLDPSPLIIPLERLPKAAREAYPLHALKEERDLHMDMLREPGERSDAHVIRYHLALDLIRPGDEVLDAACGLGYGSYVMAQLTRCAGVLGMDGSDYAIAYAEKNFTAVDPRLTFRRGYLPNDLADLADESFDVIVSFETLEHIEDPAGLLAEFSRLLKPGGRVIVSVPNDWSDETGKDPNPHHLHVYTLDSLRQQFSSFFSREHLHQQIASGCKTRASGQRWTPLPRTLRKVHVDTEMEPDSEWWVMSGTKPLQDAPVNLDEPWYAEMNPPWREVSSGERLANGLVLAFHCVPHAVAPGIERFWEQLSALLSQHGHTLILVSTTPVESTSLNVIDIPYELTEFPRRYPYQPSLGSMPNEREIMDVVSWYRCDYDTACRSLQIAHEFFGSLLNTLRPSAVLGWQSLNPVTRVLRARTRASDIPFWSGERGWVRNTLMFDQGENHYLSEAGTSLSIARLREHCTPAVSTIEVLRTRALGATELGRYASTNRLSREDFRSRNNIPADAYVVAFFSHGEPSLNALDLSTIRELHDTSSDRLQQRLDAVTDELLARGCWLLVQEHPFNTDNGRALKLRESPHVLRVSENVSTLFDAADHYLFSPTTLQFDAVFLEKSFGLMARSALYRDGLPPFIGDHDSVGAFLDAVMDQEAWPSCRDRLRADVAFLYENLLIDIEPNRIDGGAERLATHLARFVRPVDGGFHERVEHFIQKWARPTSA
jgi:2-polyprenyl-3-methyl-5-hydroxy-6-metoxy-1,4-benzoquinol methylase